MMCWSVPTLSKLSTADATMSGALVRRPTVPAAARAGVERCWQIAQTGTTFLQWLSEPSTAQTNNVSADVKGDGRQGGHSRL